MMPQPKPKKERLLGQISFHQSSVEFYAAHGQESLAEAARRLVAELRQQLQDFYPGTLSTVDKQIVSDGIVQEFTSRKPGDGE